MGNIDALVFSMIFHAMQGISIQRSVFGVVRVPAVFCLLSMRRSWKHLRQAHSSP